MSDKLRMVYPSSCHCRLVARFADRRGNSARKRSHKWYMVELWGRTVALKRLYFH